MKSDSSSTFRSIGFDEFQEYRRQMLDKYDSEKRKAANAPVRAWHGEVAEAEFRRWLRTFLPDKFGVTKGSVVHPKLGRHYELREYDVIIYDRYEANVLWKKEAPSQSPEDVSRGIQAEYVHAIFEVKATLTGPHAKDALEKLQEVNAFQPVELGGGEAPHALNPNFFCGVIFFELQEKYQKKSIVLDNLLSTNPPFGYSGGLVLRAEGDTLGCSGRIELGITDSGWENKGLPLFKDLKKLKFKPMPDRQGIKIPPQGALRLQVLSEDDILKESRDRSGEKGSKYHWHYEKGYAVNSVTVPWQPGSHLYASLTWSKSAFSRFAFEIAERLKGSYVPGRVSSLHGLMFDGRL